MSAGLSLVQNLAPQEATTDPLTSVPSSLAERSSATWDAAQAGDRYWNIQSARKTKADKIIADYQNLTGERLRNPFDNAPTVDEIRENLGAPTTAIYAKRLELLRQKTGELRNSMPDVQGLPPDYLNPDYIDSHIGQESTAAREKAGALEGTGNGIPNFIVGSAAEMASPHGVASMFLPVTRLPTVAAEGIAGRWLANIGREALFQGGVNLAAQIPAEIIDYNTRTAIGTEPTREEVIGNLGGAAVGGALLGGAFRGVHLGIRKLRNAGHEVPPAVRDASLVLESRELYGDKNALGVPAAAHEATLDRAVVDVAHGRPIDTSGLPPPSIHDAVRASNPELMDRYDQAVEVRDAIRRQLNPDDQTIATLQQKADTLDQQIRSEPMAGDRAAAVGAQARTARLELEDAIARKAALEAGAATETDVSRSLRQQLMDADATMRDLLSDIRGAYRGHGEQIAATVEGRQFSPEVAKESPRLTPEETARVAELKDNLGAYEEQVKAATTAEDRAAWQSAIDAANDEIARIMDTNIEAHPAVQKAVEKMQTPVEQPILQAEPEGAGRPKTGETPQDKALDRQVKDLVSEEGTAPADLKRAYEAATQAEKEANIAIGCVMGGPF